MKGSEDNYTIIIFRGARANPLRLRMRKSIVRRTMIVGICALLIQGGILAHYLYQRSQLTELEGLRKELSISRERTSTFAMEVDGMKKRMVSLESLSRKLQTMFGLETDDLEGMASALPGQGGEEVPFEDYEVPNSGDQVVSSAQVGGQETMELGFESHKQFTNIESGLRWLKGQAEIKQQILKELAKMANQRMEQWAATPSIWPVKGHITSKFGPRISPFTGKRALHSGVDIGAPRGTEVIAPAAGKVVVAAYDARMGKFVRIDHGYGIETTYGHLSKIHVKYGMKVKRGDLIGLVGSTGKFSTGPHLHYQVAVNDRVVDPLQYILD